MKLSIVLYFLVTTFSWAQTLIDVRLLKEENVRTLQNQVLEIVRSLPMGTVIHIPSEGDTVFYDFRNSQGQPQRSTNGFYQKVRLISVPGLSSAEIQKLNEISLFMSTTAQLSGLNEGSFPARPMTEPTAEYLISFTAQGKPHFDYDFTTYYQNRFGTQLNRSIPSTEISQVDQLKWQKIMEELRKASDRSKITPKEYLYTDLVVAERASLDYEQKGIVAEYGAWTIAVKATAVRNGFPNVPCAEFVSEMIRQAYERAGYDVFEDFNDQKGNKLIWSDTAAVVNLATALFKAGWVPWELETYKPMIGAPTMHARATTPGHAYLIGGHDGQLIVDNGAPSGRDLRQTTDKIIKMMYLGGVFFLPPGIIPKKWD
jgi:hypothetical protein